MRLEVQKSEAVTAQERQRLEADERQKQRFRGCGDRKVEENGTKTERMEVGSSLEQQRSRSITNEI